MDEASWLTSTDPASMLEALLPERPTLHPHGGRGHLPLPRPSDRKLRLFACAVALHAWGGARGQVLRNVDDAYAAVERGHGHRLFDESPRDLVESELTPACLNRPGDAALFGALLREIVGNPFRPVAVRPRVGWIDPPAGGSYLQPAVLTPAVVGIARRAYDLRDWAALPILADALEDAGCEDVEILMHCRGKGRCGLCRDGWRRLPERTDSDPVPNLVRCWDCAGTGWVDAALHCRGCWVLDLILGKE